MIKKLTLKHLLTTCMGLLLLFLIKILEVPVLTSDVIGFFVMLISIDISMNLIKMKYNINDKFFINIAEVLRAIISIVFFWYYPPMYFSFIGAIYGKKIFKYLNE
ncbi:hypothetical protein OSSY52_16810 [Tepiditoga spiralis]|uniref:Uncharacterized protein n=1 Tax=Tepiditoga spiralis TaxID=2108365 RepID=A0A7G1G4S6_9BACT|nr:hypothetical protein [Tepiditoga spiralis]BBE31540.1 hypothetical protein OSSY52_16810 [Tepiditoga spiralis]